MESREERAERRRRTWTGGVARSFEEADEMDLEFWMNATPAERLRGVTQLVFEMHEWAGDGGSPPRLQRAVGGVRKRRG